MFLKEICEYKRFEVQGAKDSLPPRKLIKELDKIAPPLKFADSLSAARDIAVIAEIKRASPSKGIFRENFNPQDLAVLYEQAGAHAVSVITDSRFFMGEPGYISIVKNTINLPVLRKDFIIDEYQIYESRYLGADAVLLIAAVLDDKQLKGFYAAARELGMDCLVEVHSEGELYRVLETGAELVGINNRDLHTFKTDLSTTLELAGKVPPDRFLISESGISTRDDVEILKRAGVRGILIGEALVRADDIRKKLGSLLTENA